MKENNDSKFILESSSILQFFKMLGRALKLCGIIAIIFLTIYLIFLYSKNYDLVIDINFIVIGIIIPSVLYLIGYWFSLSKRWIEFDSSNNTLIIFKKGPLGLSKKLLQLNENYFLFMISFTTGGKFGHGKWYFVLDIVESLHNKNIEDFIKRSIGVEIKGMINLKLAGRLIKCFQRARDYKVRLLVTGNPLDLRKKAAELSKLANIDLIDFAGFIPFKLIPQNSQNSFIQRIKSPIITVQLPDKPDDITYDENEKIISSNKFLQKIKIQILSDSLKIEVSGKQYSILFSNLEEIYIKPSRDPILLFLTSDQTIEIKLLSQKTALWVWNKIRDLLSSAGSVL